MANLENILYDLTFQDKYDEVKTFLNSNTVEINSQMVRDSVIQSLIRGNKLEMLKLYVDHFGPGCINLSIVFKCHDYTPTNNCIAYIEELFTTEVANNIRNAINDISVIDQ